LKTSEKEAWAMIALNMARLLKQVDELDLPELSYPYVYSDKSMMKLFLYLMSCSYSED
jgi:hypothetical protein